MDINFPTKADSQEGTQSETSTYTRDPFKYMMLPSEDGESADNRLLVLAFPYNRLEWFKDCPLVNWHLDLKIHYVQKTSSEGRVYTAPVICERSMNYAFKQLSRATLPVAAPFPDDDECAFCDASAHLWDEYAELKKERGIDNLSTEEFKQAMNNNPDLQAVRNKARQWGAITRTMFVVFDYDKYAGSKMADSSECFVQYYFGPEKIAKELAKKQRHGYKFWDVDGGKAKIVVVTRDNDPSAQYCEYSVDFAAGDPELDGGTLAYLQELPEIPDCTTFIERWTAEEKAEYVKNFAGFTPKARRPQRKMQLVRPSTTTTAPARKPSGIDAALLPPPPEPKEVSVSTNEPAQQAPATRRGRVNWS